MTWTYEGVTCDDEGNPRGRRSHIVVCDEDGAHVFPGTCRLLMCRGSMTISLGEAGPSYQVPQCKVCHLAVHEARKNGRSGGRLSI